ncbi:MAG: deoxyribodipyrimidine photo-lyase [Deltaproteobacteria bacterium]|nr:deoxyribodipyrimidine photo-lyase [Deltaproteobacteria bacterium]
MQQSQRAADNHALEYAVRRANELGLPVRVVFGLWKDYPEANTRHFTFLLEGLRETQRELRTRGVPLLVSAGHPTAAALAQAAAAALLVTDCGYLRHQRGWRSLVAEQAPCRVAAVESDAIVPVETASNKAEYGAYTIRRKLWRQAERFLVPVAATPLRHPLRQVPERGLDLEQEPELLCRQLGIRAGSAPPVSRFFRGGGSQALIRFRRFLKDSLARYQAHHNQPQCGDVSCMSPYLHFGQISPLRLALELAAIPPSENSEALEEQLLVRRELALNHAFFNRAYDAYEGLPAWAQQTLEKHALDPRPYRYPLPQLEAAETHDPYWNACMTEMRITGFLHNYLRMYWGKKILEWSASPQEGFAAALALNNAYFLDGRDPNSYAGVGWVFGLHDRPWPQRPIFGKVRSMTAAGLERKCDIRAYLAFVATLL